MEQRIGIERMEEAVNLFGSFDENIRLLEAEFQVQAVNRGGEIVVSGEPENVMLAVKAVQALLTLSNKGETITDQHVRYVIGLVRSGQAERISELTQDVICITSKGRPVKPKTIGQKEYVNAILKQTVTIGVGPAGTGKTYLAVAAAVAAFRDKQVNRIILTRPAVEAGERLGFRRSAIEGGPLPAPAVRRTVRHAGRGDVPEVSGARQHRGGAPGLYARADAGRQLYHSGRGPEHQP